VRDPRELREDFGHITGATNIPVTTLAHRLAELESYRDREIVAICKAGGRAHTAAQILVQAGFPKVHVMMGGMMGWKETGFVSEQ
jgi:rhodanese-related sulfurtransferase